MSRRLWIPLAMALNLFPVVTGLAMEGEPAPVFSATTLEGQAFHLADHLGKKAILLDWWSINCRSCVQAIPSLIDIHERYKDELLVIGMNVDSFMLKRVRRFLDTQTFTLTYPTVIDERLNVMKLYKSSILPTTVIIDKNGKVAYSHVGYKEGDEVEFEENVKLAIAPSGSGT